MLDNLQSRKNFSIFLMERPYYTVDNKLNEFNEFKVHGNKYQE